MKLKLLLFLINCIALHSCATIYNNSSSQIKIHTTQAAKLMHGMDTLYSKKNKTVISVPRSQESLILTIQTDSLSKQISIPALNSFNYYMNIPGNMGIGLLVEKKHPKRYGYPRNLYLNEDLQISPHYSYHKRSEIGNLSLLLSIPYINSFLVKPTAQTIKSNLGFLGIGAGLEYEYSTNRSLQLSAKFATDFQLPFPAPLDVFGEKEYLSSFYLIFSNQYYVKQFSLGYGLSLAKNTWNVSFRAGEMPIPPDWIPIKERTYSLGLAFPLYYNLSPHFGIGCLYRPTFLQFDSSPTFRYEQLISLEFAWKIGL